jgi:hypothetical protein
MYTALTMSRQNEPRSMLPAPAVPCVKLVLKLPGRIWLGLNVIVWIVDWNEVKVVWNPNEIRSYAVIFQSREVANEWR